MTQAVTAGQSAEARLQAATQLRKLNRSSRSASEANLAGISNGGGGGGGGGKRSPSPEVIQSAFRSEQLMPAPAGNAAGPGGGARLERVESGRALSDADAAIDVEAAAPAAVSRVSFEGGKDEEQGSMPRP
jgi:hypothetical protein